MSLDVPRMTIPRITIDHAGQHAGETVEIAGWLYNLRRSGKICFPQVRDGTGIIQCVAVKSALPEETFEKLKDLTQESSLIVRGKIRAEARAPGGFELDVESAEIMQRVPESDPYPITPKEHGVNFLMDHRHLWLRSKRQHAVIKVRHEVIKGLRDYFDSNGFTLVDTPIFTPSACEGTTTLFEVAYSEEEKVYLTQSGQLYVEATALALGKVYSFGPTFRAEKSKTRRHLTEFWMVEPEVAYCDLAGDMELAEQFVSYIVGRVLERRSAELKTLERDTTRLQAAAQLPYPRISYDEAVERLKNKGVAVNWGDDFGGDEETALSEEFDRPVMVHRYPTACKAFYMKQDPARPEVALCVDMLAPEGHGEIIGGGQREDDYETLRTKITSHGLPLAPFEWYLDLRRYGSVPHAGFGMGIERMTGWLCGIHHIRETVPFPRLMERLEP